MKRFIIILALVALAVAIMAPTALASNMNFNFYMVSGGASDYSYATYKSDGENAWYVTPKSYQGGYYSNWVKGQYVYFRVRFDSDRTPASGLMYRNDPKYGQTFSGAYLDSTPSYGIYYRLYSSNPAGQDPIRLVGTWCP
jgi:hypothetical protein